MVKHSIKITFSVGCRTSLKSLILCRQRTLGAAAQDCLSREERRSNCLKLVWGLSVVSMSVDSLEIVRGKLLLGLFVVS